MLWEEHDELVARITKTRSNSAGIPDRLELNILFISFGINVVRDLRAKVLNFISDDSFVFFVLIDKPDYAYKRHSKESG